MIYNESDLINELAIANVTATVKILNEQIELEKDERLANELKAEREMLIQVLKELEADQSLAL
jgi:hypothetical protein